MANCKSWIDLTYQEKVEMIKDISDLIQNNEFYFNHIKTIIALDKSEKEGKLPYQKIPNGEPVAKR